MAEDNTKPTEDEEPLIPDEAPEAPKGSSKLKKILIILIPLLLLGGGGAAFYFLVLKAPKQEAEVIEQNKPKAKIALEQNAYLDIDPITIGLTPSGPKREYLRIDLTLRVNSEQETVAILEKMPLIKDSLIIFLRSLRSTDFNSSSSTFYLKEEITKRINKIIAPLEVKEVLFQEITVN